MIFTFPTFTVSIKGVAYSMALLQIGFSRVDAEFYLFSVWKDDYNSYEHRSLIGFYASLYKFAPAIWFQLGFRKFNTFQLPRAKDDPNELPF